MSATTSNPIGKLALLDERKRRRPFGVVDQGELSQLVGGGGGHSEDHGSRKLGNNVRPPSTKIV